MPDDAKTECRTPVEGRNGVPRIPTWKYEAVRKAVLSTVGVAGDDGILFSDLVDVVRDKMPSPYLEKLGSLGWHATTVKLNMEVAGELKRGAANGPQRRILT